jgi:hypothetical protein
MDRRDEFQREIGHHAENRAKADIRTWKAKVGDNTIRILPNWKGEGKNDKVFYKKFRRHFGVGPEKKWVVCRKSFDPKETCPICDHREELRRTGIKEDSLAAAEMSSRERFAINVVDTTDVARGVLIWEVGSNIIDALLALFNDEDYKDMDSLETGRNIRVKRQGEGKNDTRYQVVPGANPTRISAQVMAKVNDLDAIFQIPSPEECLAALQSGETPEEEDKDMAGLMAPPPTEPDGEDEGRAVGEEDEIDINAMLEKGTPVPAPAAAPAAASRPVAAKTRAEMLSGLRPKTGK